MTTELHSPEEKVAIKFISPLHINNCRRRLLRYNRTFQNGWLSMISEMEIVATIKVIDEKTYYYAVRQKYRSRLDMFRDKQHWLWSPLIVSGYIHRLKQRQTLVLGQVDDPFSGRFKIFAIHMVPVIIAWAIGLPIYLSFREVILPWIILGIVLSCALGVYTWYLTALDRAALMGVVRDAFGYISASKLPKSKTMPDTKEDLSLDASES